MNEKKNLKKQIKKSKREIKLSNYAVRVQFTHFTLGFVLIC